MAKMKLEFDGLKQLVGKLESINADANEVTEKVLITARKHVTTNLKTAMNPHNKTGATVSSLVERTPVKWVGNKAQIEVGFNLSDGGLPSVFLMYGTPKMSPDKHSYNAIYGRKTIKEVRELEENIFLEEIRKAMS